MSLQDEFVLSPADESVAPRPSAGSKAELAIQFGCMASLTAQRPCALQRQGASNPRELLVPRAGVHARESGAGVAAVLETGPADKITGSVSLTNSQVRRINSAAEQLRSRMLP